MSPIYKPAVALFAFNRPDCTKAVFEEIRSYRPEKLFLVADGPRSAVSTDKLRCEAVREIMQSVDWDCQVKKDFAQENLGCKKRMWSGFDWVFSQVEEAIFLEDDCLPCPDFFIFCSEMLARYRDNPQVMHITGTNYQAGKIRGDGSYYFSRYSHGWGWASWRRAWKHFDFFMRSWPQARQEKWLFKTGVSRLEREYWNGYFERTYAGELNCWDFQWFYACWRRQGLTVTPNVNLISNIGGGPDATHTRGLVPISTGILNGLRPPKKMLIDRAADQFTFDTQYAGEINRNGKDLVTRVYRKLSKLKRKSKALFLADRP